MPDDERDAQERAELSADVGAEPPRYRLLETLRLYAAERLRDSIPAGREVAAFEMMAWVPHPDAANVLTVIGKYHPDKRIAKLARKSAYKAASRQVTAQRR